VAVSEHDDPTEEHELYEEVPPRSIFSALWFRIVLLLIVVGVIGAVSMPYVLDWLNPPMTRSTTTAKSSPPPAVTPDKDKKDSTLIPAPVTPSAPAPAPARPEPRAESKATLPSAKPAEPKVATPKSSASATPDGKNSAMAVTESPKPPATAKPAAKPDAASKPDTVAKADSASKTKDDTKPATATKAPTTKRAVAKATPPAAARGPFWVQVGAFRDAETAKRVAAKLRAENFKVEESITHAGGGAAPARSAPKPAVKAPTTDIGADQYDVYVSGQTTDELTKRLAAKGLAAEASPGGLVVKPSLPLRDAVALSKDLAVEGFKVQVKRAGGTAAPAAAAPSTPPPAEGGGEPLHRVRVGAFADRGAAQAAVKELEAKGYKPYIARGDQ
jgi:cell division septation protein DedD